MKKRLFCILLALVLMFTLLPCSVFAEGDNPLPPDGEYTEPNVPDAPDTPDVPDTPDTPDEPNIPDTPDTPDVPDTPDEPDEQEIVYPELKIVLEGEKGTKLAGGSFALKGADDAVVKEWKTDENGEFSLDYFTDGEYVLEQTESHAWYQVGAESKWQLVVSDSGMSLALYRFDENGDPVIAATGTTDAPAEMTVVNSKKLGALVIEKSVSFEKDGAAAETADWTDADENEGFELILALSDENGTPIAGTFSGVEFAEGTAVIALKDADSVTLEQLPYGTHYTVTPQTYSKAAIITVNSSDGTVAAEKTEVTVSYDYRFMTCNEGLHAVWVDGEDNEQTVSGGKAALLNSDGTVIAECEADVDGKIWFEILEEGTYTLKETAAPDGYFPNVHEIELTAAKDTKLVDGVTEEHMVITSDDLAVNDEGVFLLESMPIQPVTISVNAIWAVPDGYTATPDAVEVQLYRDGEEYGDPVTLNADNNWKHSWSGGAYTNAYAWDVAQTEVPDGYTEAVITEDGYAFSVVNELEYSNITVSVSKSWLNPKNYDQQPTSVKVVLYRNGEVYETVTLGETNGWMHRWKNLPNCFVWTVDEPTVPENYKKKITHVGNAWVIVNAHKEIPLTGDDSHVGLWAGATAAALSGFGLSLFHLLKKRKNDDE